jgi:NAD(P)-dependent dehydrogenase (short-subunit alcohol dehydrogenase family)
MPSRKRRLFVKTTLADRVELEGKRMIVTGASPGSLGFETARILASWGARVAITTRKGTSEVVEQLRRDGRVSGHPLDLCDSESVTRFVHWYLGEHGEALDVLVNNAGVHLDLLSQWKEPRLTNDGFEIQWRTNYLGTMHLTHSLLPSLERAARSTGEARIVNVVSRLHHEGTNSALFGGPTPYHSWKAYGGSKLAMVHATFEAERRFAESLGIRSYCLHPGAVSTNVAAKGLEGTLAGRARNALLPVEALFLKTPEEGAQTQVHCATAPGLPGGIYYDECAPAEVNPESSDAEVAKRLWDETAAWAGSLA